MRPLLVATNNPGKLSEILALLEDLHLEIVTPLNVGFTLEVEENGNTYAENAALKARAFARHSHMVSLADDSGLEVDALAGLPGVHSARFSPLPNATDADRRALLLDKLSDHPRPWKAHFHCTVALATPEGGLTFTDGDCPGEIIPTERGTHGFGYDPIFLLNEINQTIAELSMQDKNRFSHRARAIKAAIPLLYNLLQLPPT